MSVEERGSFGYRSLLGVTSPHYAPGAYATPIMGCPVAGQHLWAGLVSAGRRVLPIRHFINEVAGRALAYAGDVGADLGYVKGASAYNGLCELGELDGEWGTFQPSRDPSFRFTVAADGSARWVDLPTLDLRLQLDDSLPALQFVTPDAREPLGYLARPFRVTGGTALGEPVSDGYAFHEQVYLRSGHGWALSHYKKELQIAWVAFLTRYADGEVEWGQLCWGRQGWSFAVIVRSNGEHITVTAPQVRAGVDSDGLVGVLDFDLGSHGRWTWRRPEAGGGRIRLPGPPESTPQWSEGLVRRDGDGRDIAFAHTWAEIYPTRIPDNAAI